MQKTNLINEQRLNALESEQQVRRCMNRYMTLCDSLGEGFELQKLTDLFSENAVWRGVGSRYAKTFGEYQGRENISDMFKKYTTAPAHFAMNAHFLCNELIDVQGDEATGGWMLIQPSTFSDGKSQLSCARLTVGFVRQEGNWLIEAFCTENIFSRAMKESWDNPAALAVPTNADSA